MTTRRSVLLGSGAVVVTTFVVAIRPAGAQQLKVPRIGWLSSGRARGNTGFDAFRNGMRDLGYVEGRTIAFEARWGDDSFEQLDALARELLNSKPDVIVTQGAGMRPLFKLDVTIPVVFVYSGDPVEARLADSFARPGRNFTGISLLALDLVGKRMELLKAVLPSLKRVAVLANPEHPGKQSELRASGASASALGLTLDYYPVRNVAELDVALALLIRSGCEAIDVFPDAIMSSHAERIAAYATQHRLPAVSGRAEFARRGNVLGYGPDLAENYARVAAYVDKILKGAKPGDLPIELPSRFQLVINLKTAKAIGLTVPQSLLLRADEVIQ